MSAPVTITGRHVLMGLIAFFGVMLIANGFFLYYALSTFSGFAAADAYRKGLNYNDTVAEDRRQTSRGWQATLDYDRGQGRLMLRVSDHAGRPVTGLRIEATLSRPATDREDRPLALTEVAPALYAVPIRLEAGQWVVAAEAFEGRLAHDPTYRLKERLWISAKP